eukprot:1021800-Prymnesium_polylepis.1
MGSRVIGLATFFSGKRVRRRRRRRRYLRSYTATHKTPRVHRARARTGMPTCVLPHGPGWSMDNKAPQYTDASA